MNEQLKKAKAYLDSQKINRAKPGSKHQYERHDPAALVDNHVYTTVSKFPTRWDEVIK